MSCEQENKYVNYIQSHNLKHYKTYYMSNIYYKMYQDIE